MRVDIYLAGGVRAERDAALAVEFLQAIDGAVSAVSQLRGLGRRITSASGADRNKINLMLQRVGLWTYFDGRIFSGHETPGKPAPTFIWRPRRPRRRSATVPTWSSNTPTGVTAGVAAGATVWGYSPPGIGGHGNPDSLRAAGAVRVFEQMGDLPRLLA